MTMRTKPRTLVLALAVLCLHVSGASAAGQMSFEQAVRELGSPDAGTRLKTVQLLKDAAYPEAAVPLAKLVTDSQDEVQLEAMAAELNTFLAEKIITRKRVGLIIEVRNQLAAEAAFLSGPLAIGARPVPMEVLTALRAAWRDDNPRVRLEAVYTFGVLAVEPGGDRRREVLQASGPELAAMIGAIDPAQRYAALRVIARVFERRPGDPAVEQAVGDAVISALNEKDAPMRIVAMQALGAMRYERAVQGLMDLFQYFGRGELAEVSLDAVAHIAHPSSVAQLQSQLGSKDAALRGIAIEGLARVGDRAKLADVQAAVRGERTDTLVLAGSFASLMLSGAAGDPVALLAPLVSALGKPRLRDQARGYLADAALGRAQAFSRYLADPDPAVRAELVDALGLGGDGEAVQVLAPLAADRDPQVVRAVERALARLRQGRSAA